MPVHFRTFSHIDEIDRDTWNKLAEWASPMMEWDYFHALEGSGSVTEQRGYYPSHLIAYSDEDQQPMALAPLYERDRAWVEFGDGGLIEFLSELTGLPFHKGIVGTIPFTPVPAYQFLHRQDVDSTTAYKTLLNYIDYICHVRQLSTSRIYFVSPAVPALHRILSQQGYISIRGDYCMWFNRDYHSFDEYLGSFKSSRRTKIKRELRSIREQGITISMIEGEEAGEDYFENIYDLYLRTWTKHMGYGIPPFLNEGFFQLLSRSFRRRLSFSVASKNGRKVAMALFYRKLSSLYGRYWGYFEDAPFLHFATCYYYPIEYAIRKGFRMMDPGFGGEHKLYRGYEVVPVHHYIKFYGEQQRRIAGSVLKHMGVLPLEGEPRQ